MSSEECASRIGQKRPSTADSRPDWLHVLGSTIPKTKLLREATDDATRGTSMKSVSAVDKRHTTASLIVDARNPFSGIEEFHPMRNSFSTGNSSPGISSLSKPCSSSALPDQEVQQRSTAAMRLILSVMNDIKAKRTEKASCLPASEEHSRNNSRECGEPHETRVKIAPEKQIKSDVKDPSISAGSKSQTQQMPRLVGTLSLLLPISECDGKAISQEYVGKDVKSLVVSRSQLKDQLSSLNSCAVDKPICKKDSACLLLRRVLPKDEKPISLNQAPSTENLPKGRGLHQTSINLEKVAAVQTLNEDSALLVEQALRQLASVSVLCQLTQESKDEAVVPKTVDRISEVTTESSVGSVATFPEESSRNCISLSKTEDPPLESSAGTTEEVPELCATKKKEEEEKSPVLEKNFINVEDPRENRDNDPKVWTDFRMKAREDPVRLAQEYFPETTSADREGLLHCNLTSAPAVSHEDVLAVTGLSDAVYERNRRLMQKLAQSANRIPMNHLLQEMQESIFKEKDRNVEFSLRLLRKEESYERKNLDNAINIRGERVDVARRIFDANMERHLERHQVRVNSIEEDFGTRERHTLSDQKFLEQNYGYGDTSVNYPDLLLMRAADFHEAVRHRLEITRYEVEYYAHPEAVGGLHPPPPPHLGPPLPHAMMPFPHPHGPPMMSHWGEPMMNHWGEAWGEWT